MASPPPDRGLRGTESRASGRRVSRPGRGPRRLSARSRTLIADAAEPATCETPLTAREKEVFSLVVTGLLNKQIAGRLGPSRTTMLPSLAPIHSRPSDPAWRHAPLAV